MRAIAVEEFGKPPRLMVLPRPVPGPDEILVRLAAGSPNPFDRAIYEGFLRDLPHVFPLVLGTDGAGIVEATGDSVKRFAVGDAVYGIFAHEPLGKGTMAEYVAAPEDVWVAKAPRRISLCQAAAAPTAGMTALGVVEKANIRPGHTVLVVGATGGVGSFAVQLAAARGARIIATARPNAAEMVLRLGASSAVNYERDRLADGVSAIEPNGVDLLLDLISDPVAFEANAALVRDGGAAISIRYAAAPDAPYSSRIDAINFNLRAHPDGLRLLTELTDEIESGSVTVVVDEEVSLENAPGFLSSRALGGARGKAVIAV